MKVIASKMLLKESGIIVNSVLYNIYRHYYAHSYVGTTQSKI